MSPCSRRVEQSPPQSVNRILRSRIPEFDLMRALAILIILIHHLPGHWVNFYDLNIIGIACDLSWVNELNRYLSVGIFVFLSGNLLSSRVGSIKGWRKTLYFIILRYLRVIPLYLLALVAFVYLYSEVVGNLNVLSLLIHVAGLQLLFASRLCEPIFTLWFVGLTICYYLFYIIISRYARDYIRICLAVLAISFLMVLLRSQYGVTDKRLVVYLCIFALGITTEKLQVLRRLDHRMGSILFLACLICAIVYGGILYDKIHSPYGKPDLIGLVGFLAFCLINIIMACFTLCTYLFAKRVANFTTLLSISRPVAYASYCAFLLHRPVWTLMSQLYNPSQVLVKGFYLIGIGMPVIFSLSYLMQKAYDDFIADPIKIFLMRPPRKEPVEQAD